VDYADIESSDDEDTVYDHSTREGRVVEAAPMLDRVGNSLRQTILDIEGFPRRNVDEGTLNSFLERVAKRLHRVASRLGCRTLVQRDVHGVTHTFSGVGTSTPSVAASAGQSLSRSTRDTFDYGPEEIGMSQLEDASSTQQTQPRAHR